jgi:hypothetical protein
MVASPRRYAAAVESGPSDHDADRPLLAVDVDGVISLFGFPEALEDAPGELHLIDGVVHCLSPGAGGRLRRLADHYELVWATGWEERANEVLPMLLGIPELPHISFDGAARFGSAHWKLGPLEDFAGDRPLAWIDDSIDEQCAEWARDRTAPTLLVPTESHVGITDAHAEALISWVEHGYSPP